MKSVLIFDNASCYCVQVDKAPRNTQCKAQKIYWFRRHATMINHRHYKLTDVQIWTDAQD